MTDGRMVESWHERGYVTLDLGLSDSLVERIKRDTLNAPPEFRTQREHEQDDNPRIFQLWRHSEAVRRLATDPLIAQTIVELTGKKSRPFQTLNFVMGTQQPLHQDSIHFDCDPPGHMVGTWVALEDITPDCGPLLICPGSHREPRWDFKDIGQPTPCKGEHFDAYHAYEALIAKLAQRYEQMPVCIPKGHALIWQGNLIHGGSKIERNGATRWSQATHMVLDGYARFYCPMFGTDKEDPAI